MENLFFDFDGTIADTQEGIINALKYMVSELNLEDLGIDTYKKFIGPSLPDSLKRYYPDMAQSDYRTAVKTYQSFYNTKGVYQLEIYPEMKETLAQLKKTGYKLYVSSVKSESLIKLLVPHLNLDDYFSGLYGASDDETTRNTKKAILAYGMKDAQASSANSLMIGDRMTDMEGGVQNGVHTLGVTYGFGDHQELADSGADYIVDSVTSISDGVKYFE